MASIYHIEKRSHPYTGLVSTSFGAIASEDLIENQALTAAGAISLTATDVQLTTPAASTFAVTLAAPTVAGMRKVIEAMNTGGGTVTLSLANCVGGTAATTATFTNAGDTLILESNSTKWVVMKQSGVVLS